MTDSAAKRNSSTYYLRTGITPIFPDGAISQADKHASLHTYNGILSAPIGTINAGINGSATIWFFFDDESSI